MNPKSAPVVVGELSSFPVLEIVEFQLQIKEWISQGGRVVSFFGSPEGDSWDVTLVAVLINEASGSLRILRGMPSKNGSYHSLTRQFPQFHCFERECFEQFGLMPNGHPWLKPIRYPSSIGARPGQFPFYRLEGKEVHEVGVGPIHAGVIEPGHFRFMCYGESVHHLEIQLGYQHRGVEKLLLAKAPSKLAPVIETVAGDSTIAHAWAYCAAYEALAGTSVLWEIDVVRGVALELERIAMHLAGLSGLAADIAFLPGAATYGRLRTTAINTSMRLCGSRFGRGWLRPGEVRAELTAETRRELDAALRLLRTDIAPINDLFQSSRTVRHRLRGAGGISRSDAAAMGFVGMAARSAGMPLDLRARFPGEAYARVPVREVVEGSGDCWARAILRIREIDASLEWLGTAMAVWDQTSGWKVEVGSLKPNSIAVSMVEGWRGEVMHCLRTDANGRISQYKIQDPSLRNWFALALAVRENGISDFPICNKSFDLSYCGHDL